MNQRALSPDRPALSRPARTFDSPSSHRRFPDGGDDDDPVRLQLQRMRSAETTARSAEEIATMEEQAVEIERLRVWLASAKEAEENERSLRLELQQRAFEEVATATAAAGVAEA
jgi:hypothetical protein